jgi:hypothetical protein
MGNMMAQRNNMPPGSWEETHVVSAGESLSGIASHYHRRGWSDLTDWRPIYRLTRERTGLWRDKHHPNQLDQPDLIFPGDVLVIPRSRTGYVAVINKLELLRYDFIGTPNYAAEVKEELKHFSDNLNFWSDAAVFAISLGATARSAAKAAKAAETAVGPAVMAELKKKTLAAVEMGLKIVEHEAKDTGHDKIEKFAGKASKVVHVADLAHGAKEFRGAAEELRLKKEYWKLVGESVGQVVDWIDVAYEWTQPAKLSKGLTRLWTGYDVDATIKANMESESNVRESILYNLQMKVDNLRNEMRLVYSLGG